MALLDEHLAGGTAACAVRVDGSFELVKARSVPRQTPALPGAGRGGLGSARIRARRCRGHDGRVPLPGLQRGDRGQRVPPPLHLRRSDPRRTRTRVQARRARRSTRPPTSTSSSSRAWICPPRRSAARPTRQLIAWSTPASAPPPIRRSSRRSRARRSPQPRPHEAADRGPDRARRRRGPVRGPQPKRRPLPAALHRAVHQRSTGSSATTPSRRSARGGRG